MLDKIPARKALRTKGMEGSRRASKKLMLPPFGEGFGVSGGAAPVGQIGIVEDLEGRASVEPRRDVVGGHDGMAKHFARPALPLANAEHDIGKRRDKGGIVGRYEDGGAPLQVAQYGEQPLFALAVHVGSRFIQDQKLGRAGQGSGNHDPAALASREGLVRPVPQVRHVGELQRRIQLRTGVPPGTSRIAVPGQALQPAHPHHLFHRYREGGIVVHVLGNITNKPSGFLRTLAENQDPSRVRLRQPHDQPEDRGFARTVGPDEGDELAPMDVKGAFSQDLEIGVGITHLGKLHRDGRMCVH
jgi:hypothetical protein